MYLNMCSPNPSNASEDSTHISTCVDQNHPTPVRAQNIYQPVLINPSQCQRGNKMYLNLLTKHLACQRGDKTYLNMN
jgi:hypothetical protein